MPFCIRGLRICRFLLSCSLMNIPCSDEALKSGHGACSEGNGIFQTKQAGWDSDEGCSESWQGYAEACTSWMGGMAGQLLPTPKLNTKVSLPSISQGFRQNLTVDHSPCSEGHHDRLPST